MKRAPSQGSADRLYSVHFSRRALDGTPLEPRQLALEADRAGPGLSRPGRARPGREAACDLPAAGVRRRGARAEGEARPRRRGRGVSAARRRLRRELRRASRRLHPRLLPRVPANGGGADLCRRLAGGEGRTHRRPVRQAALGADRDAGRQGAAELSRRHHQRHRVHRGRAHCRPQSHADGLSAVGRNAQPAARLRARRLRQSRARASVESRLRQGQPGRAPLRGSRRAHRRDLALHARHRAQRPTMRRSSAPRASIRATRRCCSATSRPSRASIPPRATGTRPRDISCGPATARASSTTRISNICAASRIRSAPRSGRAFAPRRCSR